MRSCLIGFLLFLTLLVPLPGVFGVQRFPPPEFDSGHTLPEVVVPSARTLAYEYLDLAVLFAALVLATYLALRRRSRRGIFLLGIFSLVYFGFWRKGCVCSVGSVQNVALALFQPGYVLPLAVLGFFALPILFTLFFGRTFCSSVCPLGAVQDVVLVRPVRVSAWLEQALGMLPFLYLGAALLFAATGSIFIICQYDPFIAFFRRSGSFDMLLLGAAFLLVGVFVGRPYCRYLCPYGALLGLVSRVSKWHVRITPRQCIQCRLCEDACAFGAIEMPQSPETVPPVQRRRFQWVLLLLPVLLLIGGLLGAHLAAPFSHMHAKVRLAERIEQEDREMVTGTTEESAAFRKTGRPKEMLLAEVQDIRQQYRIGTILFGSFVGLLFGLKLLALARVRHQQDYEIHRGACVACARCFEYCPVEQERRQDEGKPILIPGRL